MKRIDVKEVDATEALMYCVEIVIENMLNDMEQCSKNKMQCDDCSCNKHIYGLPLCFIIAYVEDKKEKKI